MDGVKPSPPVSGRWKPGQSGNPGGRPKSKPYKEALDRALAKLAESGNADELREKIATAHITRCMTGDMAAIKEFADRIDGKVPQSIGGSDELPPIQGFAWIDPTSPTTGSSE